MVAFEVMLRGDMWDVVCDVRVFAITERSEMGLYDVPMFMSLFGFGIGIGMMFARFHV